VLSRKKTCSVMVSISGYRFRRVSRWEREFWRLDDKEKRIREELRRLGYIRRRVVRY